LLGSKEKKPTSITKITLANPRMTFVFVSIASMALQRMASLCSITSQAIVNLASRCLSAESSLPTLSAYLFPSQLYHFSVTGQVAVFEDGAKIH